jgi:hypothetical protein
VEGADEDDEDLGEEDGVAVEVLDGEEEGEVVGGAVLDVEDEVAGEVEEDDGIAVGVWEGEDVTAVVDFEPVDEDEDEDEVEAVAFVVEVDA